MKHHDARKILSELKDVHAFVPADEEKTVDVITKMLAGKPEIEADPRFLENLRNRLLSEATVPVSEPWWKAWQSFAKFLSVPVALAGFAAIAGTLGFLDFEKPGKPVESPAYPVAMTFTDAGTADMEKTGYAEAANGTVESGPSAPKAESSAPERIVAKPEPKPVASAPKKEEPTAGTFSEPAPAEADAWVARMASPLALEDVESAISTVSDDSTGEPSADSMESFAGPLAMGTPAELGDSAAGSAMLKSWAPTAPEKSYRYSYAGEMPAIPSSMVSYVRLSASWAAPEYGQPRTVNGYPVYESTGLRQTAFGWTGWHLESTAVVRPSASEGLKRLSQAWSAEAGSTEIALETAKVGYLSTVSETGGRWKEILTPALVFSTSKPVPEGESYATSIVVPLAEISE